ncbi:hypothetical protein IFM89_034578 [Coptis chinensis]|uniref:PROP1-like PPR domain-containing protein n=1 Tax=Coptis chinensis TaxID=261450 RepID=A0A835HLW5_9MAGN|nr:hypothetical protein IFM89_034578 [Coptis chinensis]
MKAQTGPVLIIKPLKNPETTPHFSSTMKRAKGILASLRLAGSSFPLARASTVATQHTRILPCMMQNEGCNITHHQKFYFSSKPNSIVETNEWSEELEHSTKLTHETVCYVLKKLDKYPLKALDFFNWASVQNGFKPSLTVYSLILRILGRKETIKEFWRLLKRMKDEGCDIDEETYTTILIHFRCEKMTGDATGFSNYYKKMSEESATDATVKGVTDLVLESDWNDDVVRKLGELNLVLSEDFLLRVFRALRQHPLKAFSIFRWAEKLVGYNHDAVTYNGILRVLGQEDSIKEFWSVVKELKSAGHDMDIDTYIKLSRHFQKGRLMNDAVELYELMMDGPFKPSAQNCNTLLKQLSLTDTPDLSLVFRVVKKYEASGHTPSKAVYDGIHRSLTSVGRFDEAENIVVTMRNAGYEPDNITYSQLVFGLCKAGRMEEAREMLDKMEAQGCVPDMKTWTILIQGHCTAGKIDQAVTCFTKMLEKNISVDADLLEVLVNGLCSNKKVEGAYTLVIEMVDKANLRPWQATYKNLIQKLLGERRLEEAFKILWLMRKHNFPPFPEPFIDYISKCGTVEDAIEFLKVLSVKQYPSSSAYLHVLESFIKEGRMSEARDLLYKCPHHIRNHADILNLFASLRTG